MATVTDEDVLELVERFDIPVEDTTTIERLEAALREKLAPTGVEEVSPAFLDRFQHGLTLKYEALPEAGVSFRSYYRPSTKAHPGGWWQPVYRDVATGRFISPSVVKERLAGLR